MPITLDTTNKMVSEIISNFHELHNSEYCFARVNVTNAADVTIDPIGQPIFWDGLKFVFYTNTSDFAAAPPAGGSVDSTLPDGAKIAVVVGTKMGVGVVDEFPTVTSAGTELYVVYRGPAAVKTDKIDWAVETTSGTNAVGAPALAAKQAEFIKHLEKQGIAKKASATPVNPSYIEV